MHMVPLWHHGIIAPRAPKKNTYFIIFIFLGGKCPKVNLSFEGVLRVYVDSAHAETTGNVYSYAHAKYAASP